MRDKIEISELDFDNIKTSLIEYVKSQKTFQDYNFKGSALNSLIDILAYTTHINAVNANIGINESFLSTAQFRGSVVNHAMTLGYVPKSPFAAMAIVNIVLPQTAIGKQNVLLRGHPFRTSIGGVTYNFTTTEDHYTESSVFSNIPIFQGILRTIEYIFDNRSSERFIIPDEDVDLSKLKVTIYPTQNSTIGESFFLAKTIIGIGSESPIYFLSENTDRKYELTFGDGIIGKLLTNGNVIEIEYLVTDKENGNDASIFSSNRSIATSNILRVETVSASIGGSERETIESIRRNAPLSFASQNRAVTPGDYEAIIRHEFSNIQSLKIWGGEDNNPPEYGKVFISIKPQNGDILTLSEKSFIRDSILKPKSVVTVIPEIVDADFIYLGMSLSFKYDRTKTSMSKNDLEELVRSRINQYNNEYLNQFNGIFRYSNFLKYIDESSISILNSVANVYVKKRFDPFIGSSRKYIIDFSVPLLKSRSTDSILTSTVFLFNNTPAKFRDRLTSSGTRVIDIITAEDISGRILQQNAGSINESIITLNSFNPSGYNNFIEIRSIPLSDDIFPTLNNIITIDSSDIKIVGEVDTFVSGSDFSGIRYRTFPRHA